MSLEQLKQNIPDFAKDIRLNLSNLFGNISQAGLSENQFYGTALALAFSLKNNTLVETIIQEGNIAVEVQQAAKIAATLMAMNNVYYRAVHLAENKDLSGLSANLRMNAMMNSGVARVDFELFALAVSALNGCGLCIQSHVKQLVEQGMSNTAIQSAFRLAAVLNAACLALQLE